MAKNNDNKEKVSNKNTKFWPFIGIGVGLLLYSLYQDFIGQSSEAAVKGIVALAFLQFANLIKNNNSNK